jgi:MFS superfamily sulfate permease-like transporter
MTELRKEGRLVATVAAAGLLVVTIAWIAQLAFSPSGDVKAQFWLVRQFDTLIYLAALGTICRAGWLVGQGRAFDAVLPGLLTAIGIMLSLAAVLELFGIPLILRTFFPGVTNSFGHYDPAYFAIGAVGLLLWLLGRMIRRAAAMADELAEFM